MPRPSLLLCRSSRVWLVENCKETEVIAIEGELQLFLIAVTKYQRRITLQEKRGLVGSRFGEGGMAACSRLEGHVSRTLGRSVLLAFWGASLCVQGRCLYFRGVLPSQLILLGNFRRDTGEGKPHSCPRPLTNPVRVRFEIKPHGSF